MATERRRDGEPGGGSVNLALVYWRCRYCQGLDNQEEACDGCNVAVGEMAECSCPASHSSVSIYHSV